MTTEFMLVNQIRNGEGGGRGEGKVREEIEMKYLFAEAFFLPGYKEHIIEENDVHVRRPARV